MCEIAKILSVSLILLSTDCHAAVSEGSPCFVVHSGAWGVYRKPQNCPNSFGKQNGGLICCGGDERPTVLDESNKPSDPNKPIPGYSSSYYAHRFATHWFNRTGQPSPPPIAKPTLQPTKSPAPTPTPQSTTHKPEITPVTQPPVKQKGSKAIQACAQYSKIATVFIPSNILNGQPVDLTEFPHMAALGYENPNRNGYDFDCGGSLIADQWVVTAAHCVKIRRQPVIVRMGKIYLYTDEDGTDAVDRSIYNIVRHPEYSLAKKKNDIALIKFAGTIEFNDLVRPACIYTNTADLPESKELIITGWGSIEAERTNRSEILLKANVSSMSLNSCKSKLAEFDEFSSQTSLHDLGLGQMCARNLHDNSDACQGDSGGPLQIYDNPTGVSTVVGIISFGISCGLAVPSIYTRVAYYVDWIENTVWP